MEDGVSAPLPTLEPISRPSSTSTTASVAQLPGVSALATAGSVTSSPQLRATNTPAPMYAASSPAATAPASAGNTATSCQNCGTQTTPLWRRDEMGSVLCNACGLFLKLHGRSRPISLKTDVIKSRNRVKTMRPDMQRQKKSLPAAAPVGPNGMGLSGPDSATAAALAAVRQTAQYKANGHDDMNSPGARNATASMYDPHLPVFQGMDQHQYQSPSLPQYPLPGGGSPGHDIAMNGDQQEIPQTQEQLVATNSSLKTRVSELEVINELYRGRLTQLEQDQQNSDNLRHQAEMAAKESANERALREDLQRQLDDSHRRENILKRRLDELEQELQELKDKDNKREASQDAAAEPPAKKARTEEKAEEAEEVKPAEDTNSGGEEVSAPAAS